MGKSSKPLTIIIVDEALYASPEVQGLIAKGHSVRCQVPEEYYDVMIGPRCWRIAPAFGKLAAYLGMMLAGVRAIKYPKEKP